MCYYNGQKVTREEYIRLKQLEKAIANYDFLNRDLQVGFDYNLNAVFKPIPEAPFHFFIKGFCKFIYRHNYKFESEDKIIRKVYGLDLIKIKYSSPSITAVSI